MYGLTYRRTTEGANINACSRDSCDRVVLVIFGQIWTDGFPNFIDILQRKHLNKWYVVDLEVNTVSMIPNMTGFEITEVSGHTAAMGHTWALENGQDHRDTDCDLGHDVGVVQWQMTEVPKVITSHWDIPAWLGIKVKHIVLLNKVLIWSQSAKGW